MPQCEKQQAQFDDYYRLEEDGENELDDLNYLFAGDLNDAADTLE